MEMVLAGSGYYNYYNMQPKYCLILFILLHEQFVFCFVFLHALHLSVYTFVYLLYKHKCSVAFATEIVEIIMFQVDCMLLSLFSSFPSTPNLIEYYP